MSVLVAAATGDVFALALVAGMSAATASTFLWPLDGPYVLETP